MMSFSTVALIFVFIVVVIGCITAILWTRYRARKTLEGVVKAIDDAINGVPTDVRYDEELGSLIGKKLNQYLGITKTNVQRSEAEKDAIKSLISDITHQTKTPVSNILLHSQLAKEQPEL